MPLREYIAAAALAAALIQPAMAQEEAQDSGHQDVPADVGDVGALYPVEGAGVTYDYCASCHSTMIIAQQGQTRDGWDELLQWMVDKQGMQPIPQEDRDTILDYLAEHYNVERPHFSR